MSRYRVLLSASRSVFLSLHLLSTRPSSLRGTLQVYTLCDNDDVVVVFFAAYQC